MSISDWPADERPREKLLQRGAEALTDAELLAIFLRTGLPGKSAVEVAREMIDEFGSLAAIFSASQFEYCRGRGRGPASYVQLQAVLELGRRHWRNQMVRSNPLTSPEHTRRFLAAQLSGRPYEVFACLFLDNRHRVLRFSELFRGTLNAASVHPREVVVEALRVNAAAVIFSHNHPSGVAEPSVEDQRITRVLKEALALIDVRVLDHIIVGAGCDSSFAERGLL